jgi:hypothetical protein
MQAHGLTASGHLAQGPDMTRTPLLISLVAAAALAGCNKESHTIVAGGEPTDDTNVVANANVQLPPAIVSSKIYRCADNKIVYVDYLADKKTANVRTDKGGVPTQVTAAEAGKPMTAAGGYSVEGSASGSTAKIGVPGHPAQSCNA